MKQYIGKKFYRIKPNGSIDKSIVWTATEYTTGEEIKEETHNDHECDCVFYDEDDNAIEVDVSECDYWCDEELVIETKYDIFYISSVEELLKRFKPINNLTLISKKRIA